jgi:hypothetical protein
MWAQSPPVVQRVVLDPLNAIRIPVARDRLTTVRLPSPPTDIESARVGTEPHPDALFLLATQPGSSTFSIRALVPNTNTTLNVSWHGQTYVFELVESSQPWLSVVCDAPGTGAPRSNTSSQGMPPARLLGMLDTAKAYGLLHQQHPQAVADVEVNRPNTQRNYGPYSITTEEVFRFDADDTLVFRVVISNQTATALEFIPESLMVRTGTRLFHQAIAEMQPTVPAQTSVPVYFAVTGSPDGSRNGISSKNDFMVLIQRLGPEMATPLAATTAPAKPPPATGPAPVLNFTAPPASVLAPPPKPVAPVQPVYVQPVAFTGVTVPQSPAPVTWQTPTPSRYRSQSQSLRSSRLVDVDQEGGGFSLSIHIGLNPFQ